MQRSFTLASALALATLAIPSGAADRAQSRLQGYSEVPAIATAASGRFRATIREHDGVIDYELSYTGLEGDVRQAHIHIGQTSVNGGVMVFLCQTTFNTDPTGLAPTCVQDGTVTGSLTAANVIGPAGQGVDAAEFGELVRAIRSGVAYANVHTAKYTSGEVRGQISLKNE
ncbi:CHRD domain-containing protein [Ideonella sp. YS5]|uniref:CHRD domain-containing protein n=1 Tax=Ideonella sp. YS5 TaxID=3453714 RepID=UPI003EEDD45F